MPFALGVGVVGAYDDPTTDAGVVWAIVSRSLRAPGMQVFVGIAEPNGTNLSQ